MAEKPSRRAIVAGLSIAVADLAPFVRPAPASAATQAVGPIEAGYPAYEALAKTFDEACVATWEAEKLYEEPERPTWRPGRDEGGYQIVKLDEKKRQAYLSGSTENIAKLQETAARQWDPDDINYEYQTRRGVIAKETLGNIEAWQVECRRRADTVGLTAAREAQMQADEAATAKARELLSMEPATMREAAFQAAIIHNSCFDQPDDSERLVQSLIRLADIQLYWLAEA